MSFRQGEAGNFNFYGYYGHNGCNDHAGILGNLMHPGNLLRPPSPLRGSGVGGEGAALSGTSSPSPPAPLPRRGEGRRSEVKVVDVHQVTKEADAQRNAVRQPMPAWPAAVGLVRNLADAGR